jgi:hypothetical protein
MTEETYQRGLYAGYEPNRISFYLLCLQTGRLVDLEKALWKDMAQYKIKNTDT